MINIKNKKDLITVDLRIKQIRYINNIKERGLIEFINLSNDDVEGYNFLFNNDKGIFFNTLKEDIQNFINKDINVEDLEVI